MSSLSLLILLLLFISHTAQAQLGPGPATTPTGTFTSSVRTPLLLGGTAANSCLELKSTSNGSPSSDCIIQTVGGVSHAVLTSTGLCVNCSSDTNTYDLQFGSSTARTFGMLRNTTASGAGVGLTIDTGGAASTGTPTDKAGGDLALKSGISTGTGKSSVVLTTYPAGVSSGTADNTSVTTTLGGGRGATGGFIPKVLMLKRPAESKVSVAGATGDLDYSGASSTFSIPANFLEAQRCLRFTAMLTNTLSGATGPTIQPYVKIGSTKHIMGAAAAGPTSNRAFSFSWALCGTAAPGAAVTIDGTWLTQPGFAAGSTNIQSTATTFATNGALVVSLGVTYSNVASDTQTLVLTNIMVEELYGL